MNDVVVAYRHTLRGHLDHVSRRAVAGWAQDIARPEEPVSLMITSPDIECFLVGSAMPDWLLQLCQDGIVAVREADRVANIFDRVR